MIRALEKHRIDAAFLWSICPETYSFTTSEACAANCFIITNAMSGNIAARVRETGRGIVCRDEAELFELLRDASRLKNLISRNLAENSPLELRFNPQLAEETATALDGEPQSISGAKTADSFDFSVLPDMLDEFVTEATQIADDIIYMEKEMIAPESLREQLRQAHEALSHFRNSKSHRLVEFFLRYLHSHPAIAYIPRKIFQTIWRTSSKFRAR